MMIHLVSVFCQLGENLLTGCGGKNENAFDRRGNVVGYGRE